MKSRCQAPAAAAVLTSEREVQDLRHRVKEKEMQADAALVSDKLNRHNVTKLKGQSDAKD